MAGQESPPGAAEWVTALVAQETRPETLERWIDRIAEPTLAENPELKDDPVLTRHLRASVREHWVTFLNSLSGPEGTFHLVRPAAEIAAELARRGHPSTLLFRIYRVAQQAVWEYATALTADLPEAQSQRADALVFLWSRASAWLDASIEASVQVFQVEQDRMRRGEAAQRLDAVRTILEGTGSDVRELSALLGGHPLSGFNSALLLHTERDESIADLATAANQLARRISARALVVDPGGRNVWCWLATRAAPDLGALAAEDGWLSERGITVAAGSAGEGLDGFRLSHQEARAAQKLAFELAGPTPLTLFDDVELLTLVSTSPEAARRFTTRTLGGLADPAETPSRLRQTLHALLATGSVDEASKQLHVHKNTVRYRVNQAEELLGRKAFDAPTELELALRYYELFMTPR